MRYRLVEIRRFQGAGHVKRACIAIVTSFYFTTLAALNYGRSCARYNANAVSEDENYVLRCKCVFSIIQIGQIRIAFSTVSRGGKEESKTITGNANAASVSAR